MINSDYSKAYSEVLEIISALPRSEYNKIPIKYIEYLEENADRGEGFKYNIGLPFDRQNVSEEAKDVLSVIYRLFLADNETKKHLSSVDRGLISDIKKCNENEILSSLIFYIMLIFIKDGVIILGYFKEEEK